MIKNKRPNPALEPFRDIVKNIRNTVAVDDPLITAAADALELLVYLYDAGVFDLPLEGLPHDADTRLVRLGGVLKDNLEIAIKVSERKPVDDSKRQAFADLLHTAARRVLDGDHTPHRFERDVALMLDTMASHIRQGAVDYTGMLPRRIGLVADALNDVVDASHFGPQLLSEKGAIPAGTYRVTKRVVVDELGKAEYIDEPGGVPITGLWPNTLTRIEPVIGAAAATAALREADPGNPGGGC